MSLPLSSAFLFRAFGGFVTVVGGLTAILGGCTSTATAGGSADLTGGTVDVQILAINDFHGNLAPPSGNNGMVTAHADDAIVAVEGPDAGVTINPDAGTALVPTGGAVYLATHIKKLRAANKNTAIVSAGDLTGASPLLSNLFKDEPTVLAMNAIGLDFEGVGNHDFDRGASELLRLQSGGCSLGDCSSGVSFTGAKYKYLAANVEQTATHQTLFAPYAVKTFGNASVAFVGMTLEGTPAVTSASAVQGLAFEDEVTTVNALVPALKQQGVSAIVVLLHQGAAQAPTGTYDTCDALSGDLLSILHPEPGKPTLDPAIDVVVTAHTHQAYNCTIDGRLVTSAASFGRLVTKIDLKLDPYAHKIVEKSAHNVPITRDVDPDPDVASILASFEAKAAPLANRPVGFIKSDISGNAQAIGSASCETPLGDLIADAQLAATKDPTLGNAVLALMNPGGIRTDLVAKAPNKPDGVVTYAEAFAVQPFSNNLVTVTLTGAQIQALLSQQFASFPPKILQVSSNFTYTYTYDAATHAGNVDLASIKLNGAPLEPTTAYRVTANAFLAGGGDNFVAFKSGADRLSGKVDLDAFVAHLGAISSSNAPFAAAALNRYAGNACAQ